jgi:glutathione synthase/RimK-type ligase-like ATP-grasp enzyme
MKTLLIQYNYEDWDKIAADVSEHSNRYYMIWNHLLRQRGIQMVRASMLWYQNMQFDKYWLVNKYGVWEKVDKPIRPTWIYDRTRSHELGTGDISPRIYLKRHEINKHYPMVNLPEFTNLFDNKLFQYMIFHKHMPKSRYLAPGATLQNPQGKRLVIKRFGGASGQYVQITNSKKITVSDDSLVQEFVNARKRGVLQDIRTMFIGDQSVYVYTRVAAPTSLYTNVHKGASFYFLDRKQPWLKKLLAHAVRIAGPLRVFPKRVYSLDFLYDAKTNRPLLIESNVTPGTDWFTDDQLVHYLTILTDHITSKE